MVWYCFRINNSVISDQGNTQSIEAKDKILFRPGAIVEIKGSNIPVSNSGFRHFGQN
jgi:hypothetical protein